MAASLSESGKLDVFDDLLVMEAVNEEGKRSKNCELGHVIITVLENDIFPLIRYRIDDEVVMNNQIPGHSLTVIEAISGRKMERITATLANGAVLHIHPMDLVGMFFPGLRHYQVVQVGESAFELRVVVDGDRHTAEREANALIDEFLVEKGITRNDVTVTVVCVDHIMPDARTGKTPIIVPLKSTT